jgi:hypothetical protein
MGRKLHTRILFFVMVSMVFQPGILIGQDRKLAAATDRPKLILQITIDQLRGDLPFRYRDRLGEGGFRYLMRQGTWYASAHHPHSFTETVVGHTTLATGAYPSRHGMIANKWFDRATGQAQNNIEDPDFPILDPKTGHKTKSEDEDFEKGASPVQVETTTFSDELSVATASRAKIFAVSGKDRGAVPLAGHTGKAFWLKNGDFLTSKYYYNSYPAWVASWNAANHAEKFANQTWNLLNARSTYIYSELPPYASKLLNQFGFGNTFPHPIGASNSTFFYTELISSPFQDQLTLEFAKELIAQEHLGMDNIPAYLSISLSATDLIGHLFSQTSLESEDSFLRLDSYLADLFSFIENRIGLKNTLIVLAGDHGAPELPEYLESIRVNTGRLNVKDIKAAAAKALKARFKRDNIIRAYQHPYFYINSKGLDPVAVERTIAKAVMQLKGIAVAVSCTDLQRGGNDPDTEMAQQILRNQHPKRSGDVYVVQLPQWQIDDEPSAGEPSITLLNHGSPWAYDTYVPVVFAGAKVPAALVLRSIYTVDVAPTLSAYLGIKFPSGAVGTPLTEALGAK